MLYKQGTFDSQSPYFSDGSIQYVMNQIAQYWLACFSNFASKNIQITSFSADPDSISFDSNGWHLSMQIKYSVSSNWSGNLDQTYIMTTNDQLFLPQVITAIPFGAYYQTQLSTIGLGNLFFRISNALNNGSATLDTQKLKDATKQALKLIYGEISLT